MARIKLKDRDYKDLIYDIIKLLMEFDFDFVELHLIYDFIFYLYTNDLDLIEKKLLKLIDKSKINNK